MVQLRGEKCYTVRSLDDFVWQYRVLERKTSNSPIGMIETLTEHQAYEKFLTMWEAEAHFHAVEAGEIPLMLPINNRKE